VQIYKMMMAKPYTDKTSWIGAYSALMLEKWDAINEGFKGCPAVELTNYKTTAYGFFKYKAPHINGRKDYKYNSFFEHCLNIQTTGYSWGFRGSNPADYYGTGYTTNDFQRMQLYRDLSVYKEVGRRAKLVCGGGKLPGMMSISEWAAAKKATSRRALLEATNLLPHEMDHHDKAALKLEDTERRVEEECAPEYSTDCLFSIMGSGPAETTYSPTKTIEM